MSLARHSLMYLGGRLLTGVVGLVSLLLLTRLLTAEAYGQMSVAVAVAGMIAGVVFQWLRQSLVQFAPSWPSRQQLASTVWIVVGSLSLSVLAALWAASRWAGPLLASVSLTTPALAAVCLLSLAQAWFELAQDAVRIDMRPVRFGVAAIVRSLTSLACASAAALLGADAASVVCATAVGYLLGGILSAPRWLVSGLRISAFSRVAFSAFAGYGLPMSLTLGMVFIVDSSDRLMLAWFRGAAETGIYSAAYNFSQFSVGTLLAGLTLASYPLMVRTQAESGRGATESLLSRNFTMCFGLALPGVTGLAVLAPDFGVVLLGNYVPGTSDSVIAVIGIAIGLASIRAACFDAILMVVRKTGLQTLIMCLAAGMNIVLNVLLIPRLGALGAAWATLSAFALALVASAAWSSRFLKTRLEWRMTAAITLSSLAMWLSLQGLVSWRGGIGVLMAKVFLGAATYCVALYSLVPADKRRAIASAVRSRAPKSKVA